jgi:spore coat protein U domain-containing protein, fimbrial subunit CupE1/2/3/6
VKKSDGLKLAASMIVGAWYFGATPAHAATAGPSPFTVNATIANLCTVSAANVNLGTVNAGAAAANSGSSVTLTCNKGVTVSNIVLDNGANATGTQKRMKGLTTATDFLNYNIDIPTTAAFTCPAVGTGEWNATGITTASSLFTTTGGAKLIPICASIPSGQFPSGQTYQDTVNVTVTYN